MRRRRTLTAVRAGILVTGTEVLTARIQDRNGPWVSQRLAELGVEVAQILTVADRPADLEAGLRFLARQGCELIVTTGGLGPTADDLTADVVADFAGRELVLDEEMEAKIAEIVAGFARRLRFDPEAMRAGTRKQAMLPAGAAAIDPAGTAPGFAVAVADGPTIIVLPGPPRELRAMWPHALATPEVRAVIDRAGSFETTTLRLFGIPESEIAQALREIGAELDLAPLEITTCLRRGELEIDLRHRPEAGDTAARLTAAIADRYGRFLFSRDGSTIDEQVATLLRGGTRVAVGESCTAGMLAARIADPPGASDYLAGGVVAYSDEAKSELLGVPAELIAGHGAVSPEVATAMARGALARFGAQLGIGVTGVAGPGGGSERKPVGYVCVCVNHVDGRSIARDPIIPGDRSEIRDRTCTLALHLVRRLLRGEEFPL